MSRPIEEKFLDRSELFGLRYKQGIVFFEVMDHEDTKFKPFSELEDIESGSALDGGFQQLQDSEGDDVLYLDKTDDRKKVIHAAIGHDPWQVRRYTRFPEDSGKLRSIPNLGITNVTDPFSYVDGRDSPYEGPTDAEELVIPPGVHLSFDFYNPDTVDHEPLINIKMRKYQVRVLDPRGDSDEQAGVRKIIKTASPAPIYTVGGLDNATTFNMSDEWGVDPVSMDEARRKVM